MLGPKDGMAEWEGSVTEWGSFQIICYERTSSALLAEGTDSCKNSFEKKNKGHYE